MLTYKLSLKVLQETDEWIMFFDGYAEIIIPKNRIRNLENFTALPGRTVTVEIPDSLAAESGLV
jgi:hypothetical protein